MTSSEPTTPAAAAPAPAETAQPGTASVSLAHVPFITAEVPAIGGRIKERPEDFLVEELPLYDPSGQGEHIYLLIEKKDLSTTQALQLIADHFAVDDRAIGYAGLKDRRAVTRQVVSIHVPGKKPEDFPSLRHEKLQVLWADLHTNKLRTGHLKGNRFSIKVRGVRATDALHADKALRILEKQGVPNFFGEQRFGNRLHNHRMGRELLLGNEQGVLDTLLGPDPAYPEFNQQARACYKKGQFDQAIQHFTREQHTERQACKALRKGLSPRKAVELIHFRQRQFWVNAFQSHLFNQVLAWRIENNLLHTLIEGDLAFRHIGGAVFRIDAEELKKDELPGRLTSLEISPSGPIWGHRMTEAAGQQGEVERRVLESSGVGIPNIEKFHRRYGFASGGRRPLRVPLRDPLVEGGSDEHGEYVRCAFDLPSGAYATLVMREVMKTSGLDEGE
ncbi:MAG: tRNA pseudouridine(13) synthase TruD [Phycisphaerales bacterium]